MLIKLLVLILQLLVISANGEVIPSRNYKTDHSFCNSRLVKYRSKQIPKPVELTAEVKFLMFVTGDNNASSVEDIYQDVPLQKEII